MKLEIKGPICTDASWRDRDIHSFWFNQFALKLCLCKSAISDRILLFSKVNKFKTTLNQVFAEAELLQLSEMNTNWREVVGMSYEEDNKLHLQLRHVDV